MPSVLAVSAIRGEDRAAFGDHGAFDHAVANLRAEYEQALKAERAKPGTYRLVLALER